MSIGMTSERVIDRQPPLKAPDSRAIRATNVLNCLGGSRLVTRILPGAFFTMMVVFKVYAFTGFLRDGGQAVVLSDLGFWAQAVYRLLAIAFLVIVVALFGLRKPRLGNRAGTGEALVALGGTFIMTAMAAPSPSITAWPLMVGAAVLLVVGQFFAVIGILCLGRCFGIFPAARGLVTRGPYRYVRHPLYLGEIVSGLGLLLPILNIHTAAIFAVFCGLQYWRAINEERALTAVFPEYAEYRKRTWRILPGLH